jgi:hypothetical protein
MQSWETAPSAAFRFAGCLCFAMHNTVPYRFLSAGTNLAPDPLHLLARASDSAVASSHGEFLTHMGPSNELFEQMLIFQGTFPKRI